MPLPKPPIPTLSQRALELARFNHPGARLSFKQRRLIYQFDISPSIFGRLYTCQLKMSPDSRGPEVHVLNPNLQLLAGNDTLPHVHRHKGSGTHLCLWFPKKVEWQPQMKLTDTYIPWTAEWLTYFEDWLITRDWAGGGIHLESRPGRVPKSLKKQLPKESND